MRKAPSPAKSRKIKTLAGRKVVALQAFRPPPAGTWSTTAHFVYTVAGKDRLLYCCVTPSPKGWTAMALTRSATATTEDAVLDDHAHKLIGSYARVQDALAATESFAHAWQKEHKAAIIEGICPCPEIPVSKPMASPRKRAAR